MVQIPKMTENITGRRAGMRGIVRVVVVGVVVVFWGIGCGDGSRSNTDAKVNQSIKNVTVLSDTTVKPSESTTTIPDTAEDNGFPADSQFTPNISYDTLTDTRDGKKYRTVKIGNLTWMAENLDFVMDSSWCYGDADSNCTVYGRLYTWDVAMTVCPDGWRLSTRKDWWSLEEIVGEDVAGKKLKSKTGWKDGGNSTDEFGFSALPGGTRETEGRFWGIVDYGFWWTTDDGNGGSVAHLRAMIFADDNVGGDGESKDAGLSVRCVRND